MWKYLDVEITRTRCPAESVQRSVMRAQRLDLINSYRMIVLAIPVGFVDIDVFDDHGAIGLDAEVNWRGHLHFAAALDRPTLSEFSVADSPLVNGILTDAFVLAGGRLAVPTGPGLGIELAEDIVERLRLS